MKTNLMNQPKIEKVVLAVGGTADELDKGVKLIERISGKKAVRRKSNKRIPTLNVRPGLEVGAFVTLRNGEGEIMLKKLLEAVEKKAKRRQVSENSFSFGIKEYIEIPGMQYQRDIGMRGLKVSVAFARAGRRVIKKKIKQGKLPQRQQVSREEIIKFLEEKFGVKFFGK